LLRWLVEQRLLESETADQSDRRYEQALKTEGKKPKPVLQKVFFLPIPIGNPDGVLNRALPWLRWTLSLPFVLLWLGILIYAGVLLADNWRPFLKATSAAVLPQNWFFLGLTYVALKLIHELWHGIMAKKYGAVVPEWGVQLLAFITPLTYVDASGSWRFANRWHRIYVAGAGMFIELFLAAIAVIVWVRTSPGVVNTLAYNTICAASTITILFNANPLMRFDGYYILSDLIRIPNLSTKGQQFMQWLWRKVLYAVKDRPPPSFLAQPWAIGIYGFLSFFWRWIIWIGIMVTVALLFKGVGIILVTLAVMGLIFGAIYKSVKYLLTGSGGARPSLSRALLQLSLIACGVAALGYFLKISPAPKAVAVIEYPDKAILRTESGGFVREILCENGERVEAGQVLARLENLPKENELEQLRLDIKHSELRRRSYFEAERLSAYQAETELLRALHEKLESTRIQVEGLTFRAPFPGRVHGRRLESLPGKYLEPGKEILTVLPEKSPRVLLSLQQKDVKALLQSGSGELNLRLRGYGRALPAQIQRLESRATTAVPHPALASSNGGPLLVRARPTMASQREAGLAYEAGGSATSELAHFAGLGESSEMMNQELTQARFAAYATVQPRENRPLPNLREGEWGYAKVSEVEEKRLYRWLGEKVGLFLREKLEEARS